MLGSRSRYSLRFPRLVHLREAKNFRSERSMSIYKLDWSKMEESLKENHECQRREVNPAPQARTYHDFFPALPDKYMKWVDDLQFALSSGYRREIVRTSNAALNEWSIERPFDTCIREYCLRPSHQFVNVAFRLLEDSIYDSEKNYFDRSDRKYTAKNLMLYRFWFHQTGWGLIWERSELNEKQTILNHKIWKGWETSYSGEVERIYQELIDDMKEHEENFKKHIGWPPYGNTGIDEEGPSIENEQEEVNV